jgi:acetyl-CoA carboxylase biotin carboxyl carrier protein
VTEPEPAELLDQVRTQAVAFVTAVPQPPRALRIRAGAVELEAEWPDVAANDTPHAADDPVRDEITAPTVGVFYAAPAPDAPPFVTPGDVVETGQQVAIVEAMKLMVPVEADRAGRIVEVLRDSGDPVEYGEALFTIAPDGADHVP